MKIINIKFTIIFFFLIVLSVYCQDPSAGSYDTIESAFNPKTSEWQIGWPGKINQYDLVYNSPPLDALQGIPLGNGEVGALIWCEGSKIIIVINKSDLWDDSRTGNPDSWSERDDYYTTLRHAARVIIDFKVPIFETMYISSFNGRLNLAEATAFLEADSPFGKISMKAFVDHETGLFNYELVSDLNENFPLEISLERFGSRTYSMWYDRVERDASIGLSGTEVFADSNKVFLTQKLLNGAFAVGSTVVSSNDLTVNYMREHSRSAIISLNGKQKKEAQLTLAVTSPSPDAVSVLEETILQLKETNVDSLHQIHQKVWKSIWNRSFMDYGDDYLNNLWYLTMYYANASQGGNYPGRFTNGLWGWSHDVQNWNFYFHWNQQQLYWPLNAAGHHGLVEPYLDFRFNSLPYAKMEAKKFFDTDGAYISDITNRKGYNSPDTRHNHTPVAEIALDFWRQYQYTGDRQFLKERALPFILEAARYFDSLFRKETDGKYHAVNGTGYEGWIELKDGLTELVYARALFSTALEALQTAGIEVPEAAKWQDILENIAQIPVYETSEALIKKEASRYQIENGLFKGFSAPTNKIIGSGWGIDEEKWLTTHYAKDDKWVDSYIAKKGSGAFGITNDLAFLNGIFPSVPSAPVYPSSWIGLKDKNTQLYDVMKTTSLLIGPDVMGWDPVPIVMSRLGMTDELELILNRFPERWQIYCNGWGHIGLEENIRDEAVNYLRTNLVRDRNKPIKGADRFPSPMWPFRHMSMESMSVLATAMNESIFQSYDGILRIAPAFPLDKTGRFTLHGVGGFIVSSEIKLGKVQWISIKSKLGNACRLQLPWDIAVVYSDLKKHSSIINAEIAELKTKVGETIVITPKDKSFDSWVQLFENPAKNEDVKYHSSGKSKLGLPRMY